MYNAGCIAGRIDRHPCASRSNRIDSNVTPFFYEWIRPTIRRLVYFVFHLFRVWLRSLFDLLLHWVDFSMRVVCVRSKSSYYVRFGFAVLFGSVVRSMVYDFIESVNCMWCRRDFLDASNSIIRFVYVLSSSFSLSLCLSLPGSFVNVDTHVSVSVCRPLSNAWNLHFSFIRREYCFCFSFLFSLSSRFLFISTVRSLFILQTQNIGRNNKQIP